MFSKIPEKFYVYRATRGLQVSGDSLDILKYLPLDSVDLVLTSPPFPLLRQKTYGNESQAQYVDWLCDFAIEVLRVLKPTGSFVLDLGGAYQKGKPIRSLHNFRILLKLCDEIGFKLAEEFYWYNPAKLPSPIEWVNKRKIRTKDAVNTVWWLSKSEHPKADVTQVLVPYSERMKALLKDPEKFYKPKPRPSGHDIGKKFGKRNVGAIPPNLLTIPNTNSNSYYLRTCKRLGRKSHPARFPKELPAFFIKFLTHPDDFVVDIFSGSNTTGSACEKLGRKWLSIELCVHYAALSAIRFMEQWPFEEVEPAITKMEAGHCLDLPSHPAHPKSLFG